MRAHEDEMGDETQAKMLFEVEAWWGGDQTTIVRYIEAVDIRTALSVIPEETIVVRISLLGGLYKPEATEPKP